MMDPRNGQFIDKLKHFLWYQLGETRVMMPGRVEKYYPEEQKVDVQPLPRLIYSGMSQDDMFDFPVIPGVQVQFPRVDASSGGGPKAIMYMPIKPGTVVTLIFSDFSLEPWAVSSKADKNYDPQSVRRHDLTDAIAVPGIFPFSYTCAATDSSKGTGGPTVDPNDIRIVLEWPDKNIKSEVYLGGDTGDVVVYPQRNACLGRPDAQNMPVPQAPLKTWLQAILGQLESLCDQIIAATYGGNAIDNSAPITAIKTQLTSLMTRFDAEDPAGANNSFSVLTTKVKIP